MRFDLHTRAGVMDILQALSEEMKTWESAPRITDEEIKNIQRAIVSFKHTIKTNSFKIGGVDGSGDFPSVTYADSFVYVSVAHGALYQSEHITGLKEISIPIKPIIEFTWLPEDEEKRNYNLDAAFSSLAGIAVEDVIKISDYRIIKNKETGKSHSVQQLIKFLVRPHAADTGNLAIQLRSVAELGVAYRLITLEDQINFVLLDSTLSLPFVTRSDLSLFQEHLKRLCCIEARKRDIGFFALSKSHGLPGVDLLEKIASEKLRTEIAEHWFLRLPVPVLDDWELSLVEQRKIPPYGAVTYLFRFHKNTPVMRLDMDIEYWQSQVQGQNDAETRQNEQSIFEHLDYASHDQRCFGYPYPIKAGHDRASMTQAERLALRKMIIDAAVVAGMKPQLFRSASKATGHE